MKIDKLYNKYINLICKKFYLIAIIYLLLHLIFVYFSIEVSHFIFIFKLEKYNIIEISLFFIINLLCVIITQKIINKILIKNIFLVVFTLIIIIPLYISFIYILIDGLNYLFITYKDYIIDYILNKYKTINI